MPSYPAIEPFDCGLLATADDQDIYWETSGNPHGTPALYLHGGPGSGLGPGGYRRHFDPERYLIVGIDQRGCGRSRPRACDALDTLGSNTTQALIVDLEAIRRHLGIETWVVTGVSWGTTLALAYAQAHSGRVSALILVAVTTTSRREVDWITEGVGCVFPEAWDAFALSAEAEAGERIVESYARRLRYGLRADRLRASQAWNTWETVHVSLDPLRSAIVDAAIPSGHSDESLNFATLVTHYRAHDAFLSGADIILRQVPSIAHIPTHFIHGRHDISGPAVTAWRLHRNWPASRLSIVESEGHGGPLCMEHMRLALDLRADRSRAQRPPAT